MSTTDKLLVLGAGPIGLCVAKALKRHGIAYDQVDASDGIGGNGHHGVYEAAHIISSRRTTEFSDYPMPASFPDFPSRKNMLDYLPMLSTFDCLTVYNCDRLSQAWPRCKTEHGGFDLEKRRRGIIEGSLFVMDPLELSLARLPGKNNHGIHSFKGLRHP